MNIKNIFFKYLKEIIIIIIIIIILYILLTFKQEKFTNSSNLINSSCENKCLLLSLTKDEIKNLSSNQLKIANLSLDNIIILFKIKHWLSNSEITDLIYYYNLNTIIRILNLINKFDINNVKKIYNYDLKKFMFIIDNTLNINELLLFRCFNELSKETFSKISKQELNNITEYKLSKLLIEQQKKDEELYLQKKNDELEIKKKMFETSILQNKLENDISTLHNKTPDMKYKELLEQINIVKKDNVELINNLTNQIKPINDKLLEQQIMNGNINTTIDSKIRDLSKELNTDFITKLDTQISQIKEKIDLIDNKHTLGQMQNIINKKPLFSI